MWSVALRSGACSPCWAWWSDLRGDGSWPVGSWSCSPISTGHHGLRLHHRHRVDGRVVRDSAAAGAERRRWALPVLLSGLVALVVGCTIDYIKFDLFFGFPASEQLLYKAYDFAGINKGKHFSLHFLPSTLQAYLSPTDLRFTSVFPYVATPGLPTQLTAHTRLFNRSSPQASPR